MSNWPDVDAVVKYTEGDCWLLAYSLHKLTGFEVIVTHNLLEWEHVAVINGKWVLDINGWSLLKDWKKTWNCKKIERIPSRHCRSFSKYSRYVYNNEFMNVDDPIASSFFDDTPVSVDAQRLVDLHVSKDLGRRPCDHGVVPVA